MHPKQFAKAIMAFLGALGTWGIASAPEGYTQAEMWGLCAVVVTGLAVYAYPNKPDGLPDPRLSEQHIDAGQSTLGIAVAALVIACVCLALILL